MPTDDEHIPQPISRRFIDAVARGEVTVGGLAEAGWFEIGHTADDAIVMVRSVDLPDADEAG